MRGGSQSSPFRQSLGESRFRWEHGPRDWTTHSTIHFELCCTKRCDLFQGDHGELMPVCQSVDGVCRQSGVRSLSKWKGPSAQSPQSLASWLVARRFSFP